MMSVQQHKNWANNCNSEQKPFYYPWEAAVRWCELTNKEAVIMANLEGANNMPSRAIIAQLSAPCLLTRAQAIHHALENHKMPWCRDGKLCDPKDKPAGARLSVLHEDLKKWIAENYPDQKPKFLFDELERSTHSAITLEAYQTLEAENKRLEIENKEIRDRLEKGRGFYAELQRQLNEANARIAELEAQLSQQDKEESVKGFNTSLAIIHALYDMADSPPIKTVAAKTEEIGRIIKEDAIRNRLNNTTFKE
jgi:regulator of replication initiation timing